MLILRYGKPKEPDEKKEYDGILTSIVGSAKDAMQSVMVVIKITDI